jgi:hypothetical protein
VGCAFAFLPPIFSVSALCSEYVLILIPTSAVVEATSAAAGATGAAVVAGASLDEDELGGSLELDAEELASVGDAAALEEGAGLTSVVNVEGAAGGGATAEVLFAILAAGAHAWKLAMGQKQ